MPLLFLDQRTGEPQTLGEIREWYDGVVEAMIDQRAAVQHAVRRGSAVADRFAAMTSADVDAYYDKQRRELDRLTMLNLVASAEASIRNDYHDRIKRKLKDPLSLAYQAWHKTLPGKKKIHPDFDKQGILTQLKSAKIMDNHIIGNFRECLMGRHWVGHGRNFGKPAAVDQLDPQDVYARADTLLKALP